MKSEPAAVLLRPVLSEAITGNQEENVLEVSLSLIIGNHGFVMFCSRVSDTW